MVLLLKLEISKQSCTWAGWELISAAKPAGWAITAFEYIEGDFNLFIWCMVNNKVKFIINIILFFPLVLFGQNLVPNPSFEYNIQLDENATVISDEFSHVRDWKLLGWQSFYCHCRTHDPKNWFVGLSEALIPTAHWLCHGKDGI